MNKIYLKNIDCPSCAKKIEDALISLDDVKSARLSFPSCCLEVECSDMNLIVKTIKAVEPKVEIFHQERQETFSHLKIIFIFLSFVAGFVFELLDFAPAITFLFLFLSYIFAIKPVILGAFSSLKNKIFFDENVLMLSASFAAFFLQAYTESVAIMVFYALGEHLQLFAIFRSKKSFYSLVDAMPSQICILENKTKIMKEISDVKQGEIALYSAGDLIALDGEVLRGEGNLDTQAITGESLPVFVSKGDKVLSGSVALDSSLEIQITKTYENSFILKTRQMLEEALNQKTKAQSFITKFARYYTPSVFFIALLLCVIPTFFGYGDLKEWLYRSLVVLMVSCPCALVLAIPLGYFSAIGKASKEGILIKNAQMLEKLNEIDLIIFDKTGTLTTGKFDIKSLYTHDNVNKDFLLETAYIAMQDSKHLIAQSFQRDKKIPLKQSKELAGKGMVVEIQEEKILAGNARLMQEFMIDCQEVQDSGLVVHVARGGKYLGYILLQEALREYAIQTVSLLKALKKEVIIVSGDHLRNVQKIAEKLQCKYYAQALPEDKYKILKSYQKQHKVLFVGDGINDAPALALADIGVAMGIRGSDISKQGADILLLKDQLFGIYKLFEISKKTKNILWQNVFLSLGIKMVFIILGIFGMANIWEAIFGDVGVSLLALINALRIFKI